MSCPHGMPKPANCFDCMEEGNLPVPKGKQWEFTKSFPARYASVCTCGEDIGIGDTIKAWECEDAVRYTHVSCTP